MFSRRVCFLVFVDMFSRKSIQWFDGLDHENHIFSESISHWQPVPPCSDPVPPSTNQYHLLLAQYHQVSTSCSSSWRRINSHQGLSLTRATYHFYPIICQIKLWFKVHLMYYYFCQYVFKKDMLFAVFISLPANSNFKLNYRQFLLGPSGSWKQDR